MFWNQFISLCEKNGTKPNPVAKKLGISSGTVTGWKNGSKPNDTTIKKIAGYFGVSPDYLLGKAEDPLRNAGASLPDRPFAGLSEEEIIIIKAYRAADPEGRMRITQAALNAQDSADAKNKNVG